MLACRGQAAESFRGAAGEVEEGLPVVVGVGKVAAERARTDVDVDETGSGEAGLQHLGLAEAAGVGYPHDSKGQGIYAYVTLRRGVEITEDLRRELIAHVRQEIGPIAAPDVIQWAPGLPKTRSGKIMRRILRKIGENDVSNLGDTSTLADPGVVDNLLANRPHLATA